MGIDAAGLIIIPNSGLGAFIGSDGLLRSDFKLPVRGNVVAANTAGGVLALLNPFSQDVIIERLLLDWLLPAPGAATTDAGIAANGTTSADNLIDGYVSPTVISATNGVFCDNLRQPGTNGLTSVRWAADRWLTISTPTGSNIGAQVFAHIYCTTNGVTKP